MGMLKKLFRRAGPDAEPADADLGDAVVHQPAASQARHRELIQVVLRDSMGKHAIPSDWMECRILSVATPQGRSGVHVQLIVRQGEESLLKFVLPFQETFWRQLEKVEARPREWLFSLAWQFDGDHGANGGIVVPAAAAAAAEDWCEDTQPPEHDTQPPDTTDNTDTTVTWIDDTEDQLASDLQALYAIRDAALSEPAHPADTPAGRPAANPGPR
ncbi:hypothetical protein [Ramlibacter sp. WS9]|uniref:hypothetical protein n=1 Tax=Ramlibacter sp. WS9 TaxID=1882741 RepID=UPI00130546DB|nr:hypothetical protein [Ramlibacter sp. WS9]